MATVIKKISELEQLEELTSASNVIIEENGEAKRFSAASIGKVKTVNGVEPDENGNIEVEIPDVEIPEIDYPVTSVNGMTGNVVIEVGSGSSVQPDLAQNDSTQSDYVKNRTHWEENNQTVIEWDGSTEGRDSFYLEGISDFYKISDLTPTTEDVLGGSVEVVNQGNYTDLPSSAIVSGTSAIMIGAFLFIVYKADEENTVTGMDGVARSFTAPSTGIYSIYGTGSTGGISYVERFTYGSITIHKLDPKFLPDGGVGYGTPIVISWDGNTDGLENVPMEIGTYYKVSDLTPGVSDMIGATASINTGSRVVTDKISEDNSFVDDGDYFDNWIHILASDMTIDGKTVTKGIYFLLTSSGAYCCGLDNRAVAVNKIDPMYLPGSLIVNVQINSIDNDITVSADRTYFDILEAYTLGRDVLVSVSHTYNNDSMTESYLLPLTSTQKNNEADIVIAFMFMTAYESSITDLTYISVDIDNTWVASSKKKNPPISAIPDVSAAPTMEEFNALLAALRNAGLMAT